MQLYIQPCSIILHLKFIIRGTEKNTQQTIIKPTLTGINRNKCTFCILKSLESLKNSKASRVPSLGQVL